MWYLFIDSNHGTGQCVYLAHVGPVWVGVEGVVQHRL